MNMLFSSFTVASFIFLNVACAESTNLGKNDDDMTPEQKAQALMNEGKYNDALEILEPLYEESPDEYFRIPLLASAYAGSIGVDVFSVLKGQFSGDRESGNDAFAMAADFLPDDYDRDDVDTLNTAIEALLDIPDELVGEDGDSDFGSSAEFQLVLYQALYPTMLLNLIGALDGDINLDDLSDEEIDLILERLRGAGDSVQSETLSSFSTAIDNTTADIDEQEGDSTRDQLTNYLGSR